jgi:hypothetical protein
MLNCGTQISSTSSAVRPIASMHVREFSIRLPCVTTTPLGRPVVPDVYMIAAGSS